MKIAHPAPPQGAQDCPTLCPCRKGRVVVIFDLAVECDILAAFLALRASGRIADHADAAGGEAANVKPVINPDM